MSDTSEPSPKTAFDQDAIMAHLRQSTEAYVQKFANLKAGDLPQVSVWNWQNDADRVITNEVTIQLYSFNRDWPAHLSTEEQLAYADAAAVAVTVALRPGVPTLLHRIAAHLDECAGLLSAQTTPDVAAFRTRLVQLCEEALDTSIDPDHHFPDESLGAMPAARWPLPPDDIALEEVRQYSPLKGWTASSREEYLAGLGAGKELLAWLGDHFTQPPSTPAEATVVVGRFRRKLAEYEGSFATLEAVADYLYWCAHVVFEKAPWLPMAFPDFVASEGLTLTSTDLRYEPR